MRTRVGLPMWAAVLVVLTLVAGVVWWTASEGRRPLPTAHEAELDIVGRSGARSARCATPADTGWTCLLRRTDGGYGTATALVNTVPKGRRGLESTIIWRWKLDVGPDGAVQKVIAATPGSLANVLAYESMSDLMAVDAATAFALFTCPPDQPVGSTVTCTGSGPIPTAASTRLDGGFYRVAYRVPIR